MKNLKSAFKPAPERFRYSVQSAINEAQSTEQEKRRFTHPVRAIIAVAIIIAIIPTSVLAATNLIPLLLKPKGKYGLEVHMDTKVSKASPKYVKLNVKIPKGFKKNKHADITYEKDIDSFDNYISFLLIRPEKTARPSCLKM